MKQHLQLNLCTHGGPSASPESRHRSTRLDPSSAPPTAGPALLHVGLGAPSRLRVVAGHFFPPCLMGKNKVNDLLNIFIFGWSSDCLVIYLIY